MTFVTASPRRSAQYLGRFRREAFHGLEASGYVDARIDPANIRRSGRTRQPTHEQEFKPAVVTATAECAPDCAKHVVMSAVR